MCTMPKTDQNNSSSTTKGSSAAPDPYASLFHGKRQDLPKLSDVPGQSVAAAIDRVIANGDAVLFAVTSDGGAVSIQILSEAGRRKIYAAHQAELDQTLTALELL